MGKLKIKEVLDLFWDFYLNLFFSLDVQYWEYIENKKENYNYGNRIVLKIYTNLLNYDHGVFCFCNFLQDPIISFFMSV